MKLAHLLPRTRRFRVFLAALALFLIWFWLVLPEPLFNAPYSPTLFARNGELLGARLAADRQWRFPLSGTVPPRFAQALIAYEDKRFRSHPGVDPIAILRAVKTQLSSSPIKSGGSTLSMQVIRLARHNPPRTLGEKFYEMLLALRLECRYSKDEILNLYAQHAPFGGNFVGLETAAWRYFGRAPGELSWAEAATLAVLPNSPALIHPGRSREQLRQKRDRLLQHLYVNGAFDALDLRLALAEPLPEAPQPLPRWAPHLLDTLTDAPEKLIANSVASDKSASSKAVAGSPDVIQPSRFQSTLDADLQRNLTDVLARESKLLRDQGVGHAAALVIDNSSGAVLAYLGNSLESQTGNDAHALDLIQRPRSSGSILKPLLYALMLQDGQLTPQMLVPDVPTQINGYVPENYDRQYRGAVPASVALALSLNIPAVRLLREYGVARFHEALKRIGLHTLFRTPDEYGLTLILGGAETSLWDIAGAYRQLAVVAQSTTVQHNRPSPTLQVLVSVPPENKNASHASPDYGPGAAWLTLQAMAEVNRPGLDAHWRSFSSSRQVAWKTGTSYGLRDAWAVGTTPRHTVAVWAGNANGEGIAGLSGTNTAAPLLFSILNQLPDSGWFAEPTADLKLIDVCADDGLLPQQDCARRHERIPLHANFSKASNYHRQVQLDARSMQRVHSGCASVAAMKMQSWFVLPAGMEHFYRRSHPEYQPLPAWRSNCINNAPYQDDGAIGLLYPQEGTKVYIPTDVDGERSEVVFEAVHRRREATLHWHLDDDYLGSTRNFHQWQIRAAVGEHRITLVDDQGQRLVRRFTVIGKH